MHYESFPSLKAPSRSKRAKEEPRKGCAHTPYRSQVVSLPKYTVNDARSRMEGGGCKISTVKRGSVFDRSLRMRDQCDWSPSKTSLAGPITSNAGRYIDYSVYSSPTRGGLVNPIHQHKTLWSRWIKVRMELSWNEMHLHSRHLVSLEKKRRFLPYISLVDVCGSCELWSYWGFFPTSPPVKGKIPQ